MASGAGDGALKVSPIAGLRSSTAVSRSFLRRHVIEAADVTSHKLVSSCCCHDYGWYGEEMRLQLDCDCFGHHPKTLTLSTSTTS